MKKTGFLIFLSWMVAATLFASTKKYTYTFTPVKKTGNNGFKVCIEFKANSSQSIFNFPLVWGSDGIPEYIHIDSVSGAASYKQTDGSPMKLEIKHTKGSGIRVYYTFNNTIDSSTFLGGDTFFPLIHSNHFYFFSNSVMLVPETEALCDFNIEWKDYPAEYVLPPVTSVGSGFKQSLKGAKPVDLQNMVICGGDFRLYTYELGKREHVKLAIRGNWDFTDSAMLDMVAKTIAQQRSFWNDHSTPEYLIVMVPVVAASEYDMSFQGTGLLNSFTVAVTQNKNAQPDELAYLFHHELMHHWIGNKIQNGRDEELSYWFSEGFTDYFARMNMRDCGIMNEPAYMQTLDSLFSLHYSNPLRRVHNDSIKVHFWDDRMYGKLPYDKGALFAYYVDLKIQQKTNGTKSLKNVMQSMLKQALKKSRPFDSIWFTQTVHQISGLNIASDIKQYMIQGEFIPLAAWNEIHPGLLAEADGKIYDLGFEVNTSEIEKESVVTKVHPATGAFDAGLQNGDVLKGFSIYYGHAEYKAELSIMRNGVSMDVSFYPYAIRRVPRHTGK